MAVSSQLSSRPKILDQALDTPTYGSGGTFTVASSMTVSSTMAIALSVFLDTRTYRSWNAFVPCVSVTKQPSQVQPFPACLSQSAIFGIETTLHKGTHFSLHVQMDPDKDVKENKAHVLLTTLEDYQRDGKLGVRVAWRTAGWMPGFLLRSESVHEFMELGDGTICYTCWETFYGILSSTLKSMVGKALVNGFERRSSGLKKYCERQ